MSITDKEAADRAIAALKWPSEQQKTAVIKIEQILKSDNPFVDIHELFELYDILYFRNLLLSQVEVSWSTRLTSSAGICELLRDPDTNQYTRIRLKLSEPLLKFRPRGDTINTLLHESIHAYLFKTTSWRHARDDEGTGHGAGFLLLADAINDHGNYEITVFHTFHDEVENYQIHSWKCDGPCSNQAPSFGVVKRAMNRPPGKHDIWWDKHESECGGSFEKVGGPDWSKSQLVRMGGLKRAGLQKNKIDGWISSSSKGPAKRKIGLAEDDVDSKKARTLPKCPICELEVPIEDINSHLDEAHQQ